jgi:hypothetical protein
MQEGHSRADLDLVLILVEYTPGHEILLVSLFGTSKHTIIVVVSPQSRGVFDGSFETDPATTVERRRCYNLAVQ